VADEGQGSTIIAAPVGDVWAVVCDVESYPAWMSDIRHAAVLERDDAGRAASAEFRVGGFGVTVGYRLAYDYDEPTTVRWHLEHSNELRRMDGEYRFDEVDGGTHVEYRLTVDLRIPVLGMVKRRAERAIIHHALSGLKERVESSGRAGSP
jgi:ribosome-associated toxin RatA of RatAB toxin-antitoxin module